MGREDVKKDILGLVARHDGEWYWYQIDRALSGSRPGCFGPYTVEIRELADEGLIEIRPNLAMDEQGRYWLTNAGRASASSTGAPVATVQTRRP
jgi:hypothetical protein